jgi:hypothetical protein
MVQAGLVTLRPQHETLMGKLERCTGAPIADLAVRADD